LVLDRTPPRKEIMKNRLGIAAAIFFVGTAAAAWAQEGPRGNATEKAAPKGSEQHQGGPGPGQRAGAAEEPHGATPEQRGRSAPRETTGQAPANERTGQAQQNERPGPAQRNERNGAAEKAGESRPNERTGQAHGNGRTGTAGERTGQAPQSERRDRATEDRRGEQNRAAEEHNGAPNGQQNQSGAQERTPAGQNERGQTTAQGAAGSHAGAVANISPQQQTQIRDIVAREGSGPRVDHVDFDLAVGTVVPRSVRFVALPSAILTIEPAWRGYDYFMVATRQLVIIDPRSLEIVAVIDI
jgi:Protein of unknown function (DUF1236)